MRPCLEALKALVRGLRNHQEMYRVGRRGQAPQRRPPVASGQVLRNDGKLTLISDRLHWARSYLKKIDAVENSSRGVWTITEKGRTLTRDQIRAELKPSGPRSTPNTRLNWNPPRWRPTKTKSPNHGVTNSAPACSTCLPAVSSASLSGSFAKPGS
ncbi:MAG: winged helix-turn-helix domain-containing protein [Acidimicrobiales bacterium]